MSTIIHVENLGKRYIIGNQKLKGKKTFREAINQSVVNFGSKFRHSFSRKISSNSPYEEFYALKGINFEVEQGDRIGIIGRNGAGKSTLLKVLSRITEPSIGKITIKGRVASLLEVGTGFNGELTGRENIFLNGAILGMHRAEIKQKFDEIVDFSGVGKFLDTPVKRYSSGMYVRLAFAVAAHLEPEILVVDEVLAVGDTEFQKKCLGKMQDVSQKEGRTVLFVSHNMGAIDSLCKKVIVLESGEKVFDGSTDEGIAYYLNNRQMLQEEMSLISRTDRTGNGKIRVSDCRIMDNSGNVLNQVLSGSTYYFVVDYLNNTQEVIDKIIVSMSIYDEKEHRWLMFRSNFSSVYYTFQPGMNQVICTIENFPLTLGKYSCSIYTTYADAENFDGIENVNYFEVVGGNFFKTGSFGLPNRCKMLVASTWK